MAIRILLPGGTLKIKAYPELRSIERERSVPIRKIAGRYFIWMSAANERRYSRRGRSKED